MQRYQYKPLTADGSSIRLLRLAHYPGQPFDDPIECEIFHASIQDTQFEALSYVWGDVKQTVDLVIDGSTIPITTNLDTALRSLRPLQSDEPWILWVDAICIDQSNVDERGQQVQLMWQIYSKAVAVTVWLGPEGGDSEIAMDGFACRETQRRLEERKIWHPMSSNPCGCHAGDFKTEPPTTGVHELLRRPWFRRVWVLQEVAAAKELFIACGDVAVRAEDFYSEINGIVGFYGSFTKMMRLYRPVLEFMNPASPIFRPGTMPLSLLIEMFRSWEATDPRDKVYALLGLSADASNASNLRPDYTLSQTEISRKFIEFALPD
ncbi:heterokaryon incompatibility protein-domain-containing protein, partial [Cadophora sp. MPI-SDFR-AT-0126]